MQITQVKETCLYVKDLQRTKDFYHGKLGLPVVSLAHDRHIFFKAGGSMLLCFIAETTLHDTELPPHGATGIQHFALEVPAGNYDAALQELQAINIEIVHHHHWPTGTRSCYFHDPDGHVAEIVEQGLWDA